MKIVFATSNQNKAKEIAAMLPEGIELLTLKDIDFTGDIPETSPNLEGNAQLKADFVLNELGYDCFADDTGLEIDALNGEPGVRSARYAGEERSDEKNMNLVLSRLDGHDRREAQFRTVIALNLKGKSHQFEGIVRGLIRHEKRGENGFGYDPIFEPEDQGKTFAQMSMDEKNQFSHRARAFEKMIRFFQQTFED